MRIFAIGDVHGCKKELEQLFEKTDAHIRPGDKYVMLGDYVDRGPDSKGVVDLLIERIKNHPNEHICLKGNHEDMFMNPDSVWEFNGGLMTIYSYGLDSSEPLMKQLPLEHRVFYQNLKLYHQEGNVVCVHAGIDPSLPIDEQTERTLLWTRSYVDYDGDYYGGYKVVFGHTPGDVIHTKRNHYGIDTGCVFGGKLTCLVMDTTTNDYESYFDVESSYGKH